jgi:ATP-binding cassette subfamily C protein CydD
MAQSDPDGDLQAWLHSRTSVAHPWPTLAVVFGLVGTLATVAQAFVLAAFFQGWIFDHRSFADLAVWWYALPAAVALRALAGWAKEESGLRASQVVRESLRRDLVNKIGVLGPTWRTTQAAGDLSSRVLEQVDGLDAYTARYLAQQKLAMVAPVVILAFVFPLNWICGLLLVLTAPLIPLFMVLIGFGARAVQTKQLRSLARMSGLFLDVLRGLPTLKLLDAHRRQGAKIAEVSEEFRQRTMEVLRLAFLSSTMLEFFSVLSIALTALYLGFTLLGEINFGVPLTFQTALFVLILAPDFYQPLRDLGTLYHARAEALACAGQLSPILEATPPSAHGGTEAPPTGAPSVVLRNLTFSHRPGIPVLENLNLEVAAGETVAVTGASGVGKTTLLRLVQGQLVPQAGRVEIGGRPLEELDPELWRARIGWMGQHPRLLAASLADNLRVAQAEAPLPLLEEALDFAGLGSWVSTLPRGWDTPLGEGGRAVSGGQLRRIALARLWLRDATVLLLDEPTASLDEKTQDSVIAGLERLKRGKTTILMSHHTKPLLLADRVLSLGAPVEGDEA